MAIPEALMDLFQAVSWIVAAVGGVTAAIISVLQMAKNRRQVQKHLRWRRAKEAKDFLHELVTDPLSRDAMRMLDWDGREYEIEP
jgi:hypothetical protein